MYLKRLSAIILLAALAALAAPAPAADAKKPTARKKEARGDDVICTYEQPVGTHIKRRVCATRDQRAERARLDQEASRRMRGPGTPVGVGGSGD